MTRCSSVVVVVIVVFCWLWTCKWRMEDFIALILIYLCILESDLGIVYQQSTSFQPLPIFCHKELQLRGYTGLEWNIVTWSTKILRYRDNPHDLEKIWKTHLPRCPKNPFPEIFRIRLFVFNIKWTKWS